MGQVKVVGNVPWNMSRPVPSFWGRYEIRAENRDCLQYYFRTIFPKFYEEKLKEVRHGFLGGEGGGKGKAQRGC